MQEQISRIRRIVERHAEGEQPATILPRVRLYVGRSTTTATTGVYELSLCMVFQGAKQLVIGDQVLRYDPANYFVAAVEVPASVCVSEATPLQPYVGVSMMLDPTTLASLTLEMPDRAEDQGVGFAVSAVTPELLDAFARLLSLLDAPDDLPVLGPLHEREVLYRLLQGPHGGALRQIARADSRLSRVRQAIAWMRSHFAESLCVEELAEFAGMSPASFYRHFKAATTVSPLQYQKMLRLQEARRLILVNGDAAGTAHRVGYESASQFNREYSRMFGAPPGRDLKRLRAGFKDAGDVLDRPGRKEGRV